MKYIYIFFLAFGATVNSQDTLKKVSLLPLSINKYKVVAQGNPIWESDSTKLLGGIHANLGEQIAQSSSIPFRNYGNGLLQSISTRGLSPQHTYIAWEGLPINSALNGQQDFSLLDNPLISSASLKTGSLGGSYGSGAVGGALLLSQNKSEQEPLLLNWNTGSFGFNQFRAKSSLNLRKWNLAVAGSWVLSDNDYSFKDLANTEREQTNADLNILNAALHIGRKHNANHATKFNAWVTQGKRGLAATRAAPLNNQFQEDDQKRLALNHTYKKAHSTHELRLGYVYEKTNFFLDRNLPQSQRNTSSTLLGKYDYFYKKSDKFWLAAGTKGTQAKAAGDNLTESKLNEVDFYASAKYTIKKGIDVKASLRKGFSNLFKVPFTYDIGLAWNPNQQHSLKTSFTKSFRTPTLNDLFWANQGNPNLKPEEGYMTDVNYSYTPIKLITVQASVFYGQFNDWILWLPNANNVFSPINVQEVSTKGVELAVNLQHSLGPVKLIWQNNYQYTQTQDSERGYQLIYVPLHAASSQLSASLDKFQLYIHHNWQGKRYAVRDESIAVAGFVLGRAGVNYTLNALGKNVKLGFEVRNLWNSRVETIRTFAFPNRNILIELQFKL